MKFHANEHAKFREGQRAVSLLEISYALNNFDWSVTASSHSTRIECLMPNGHVLKIWVEGKIPLSEPVHVLSVAWKGIPNGSAKKRLD